MNEYTQLIDLNNVNHKNQITQIIRERNTMMRTPINWGENFEEKVKFLSSERIKVFGYFRDETMISFLSVMPWKSLPFYTISNFFVRPGTIKYFSIKTSGMPELFSAVINYMENLKYYTFYYVRSDDHWPIRNKKKKNLDFIDLCSEYKRYVVTVEEVINPGEKTKYDMHALMLGEPQISNLTRVIIRYTLPNKLRQIGYEFYEEF